MIFFGWVRKFRHRKSLFSFIIAKKVFSPKSAREGNGKGRGKAVLLVSLVIWEVCFVEKNTEKNPGRVMKNLGAYAGGLLVGCVLLMASAYWGFRGRVFPGIAIAGIPVGGLTRAEASEKVRGVVAQGEFLVEYGGHTWPLDLTQVGIDEEASAEKAFRVGRSFGEIPELFIALTRGYDMDLVTSPEIATFAERVNSFVALPATPAQIEIQGGEVKIIDGEDGTTVDREEFLERVRRAGKRLDLRIELPTVEVSHALSTEEKEQLSSSAGNVIGDTLTLTLGDTQHELRDAQIVQFLDTRPDGVGEVDEQKVGEYAESLAAALDQPPQDARFQIKDGRVEEFVPEEDGVSVDTNETASELVRVIRVLMQEGEAEATVEIAAQKTPPRVKTSDVNDLGIVERIGRGESFYAHSIPPRVYNVELTARKLDGTLVPPGAEFSFNRTVGEISAATGYKTAYVIQNGRTVLGDGGGVCQDSTTLFRAVMDAGLPITERWAHSYRVGYYEQNSKPGIDATVFAPSKDFRFLNDTPGHLLIDTQYDSSSRHLIIDIYGTPDGRVREITPVRVWGVTPPPPPLYQDDPSLPVGVVRQVDWAAWGAKTSFDYKVVKNGETIFEETYFSNYRPWQDVYLRGTGQ